MNPQVLLVYLPQFATHYSQYSSLKIVFTVVTDYVKSIKKSMVQYSLVKPKVSGVEEDEDLPDEQTGLDFSSPWRASFVAAREEMKNNLHILHAGSFFT